MTDQPNNSDLNPCRVVCLGLRTLSTGKPGFLWITEEQLTALNNTGVGQATVEHAASVFAKAKGEKFVTGGIYESRVRLDDGRIKSGIFTQNDYRELWPSEAMRAVWSAIEEAERVDMSAKAEHERLANTKWLSNDLDRIARYYQSLPHSRRLAFEALVMWRIRGHGR